MGFRWCWFIDEVRRAEDEDSLIPSLISAVTCEDVLLMKISLDTLRTGSARFSEVKDFAREYLGVTSHRVLYRMLGRLCGYGLIKFRRGSSCGLSDYDCRVSGTGCRITAILPTTTGLVLASTTSIAFISYLAIYMNYVDGGFNASDADMYRVITGTALNIFNAEQFKAALSVDTEQGRNLYEITDRLVKKLFGVGDGIDKLMSLAGALDLDTPSGTYAFRLIVFTGYGRRFLRLVLWNLLDKASTHGFNTRDVEELFNELLSDRVEDVIGDKRYWGLIEALSNVGGEGTANLTQRLMQ